MSKSLVATTLIRAARNRASVFFMGFSVRWAGMGGASLMETIAGAGDADAGGNLCDDRKSPMHLFLNERHTHCPL